MLHPILVIFSGVTVDWNGTVLKILIVKFHEPVVCPVGLPLVELGDLDSMK